MYSLGMRDAYLAVVPTVDVLLHQVPIPLREVGLEAVRLGDLAAFLIAGLLVGLVVAVLGVELLDGLTTRWLIDPTTVGCGSRVPIPSFQTCRFSA